MLKSMVSYPLTTQKYGETMTISFSQTGKIVLVALLIGMLLTGCSGLAPAQPTAAPTIDQQKLLEYAVQTMSAQMTAEALANPSATPTPEPTATATQTPTITPIPATPTLATPPTATATQPPPISAQALYAVTYPENKPDYIPNEEFGLALGFKNTGSIAWDAGSRLKLVSYTGEVTVQPEIELDHRVNPGEKIEFNLWAFGSETLGKHSWTFQLYTPSGGPIPGAVITYYYESH